MRSNLSLSLLLLILSSLVMLEGCQESISEEERQQMAQAYAEMLIAKNMVSGDSAAARRAVDSVLKTHGFADEKDLMTTVQKLTTNPDQLREMLDSTQQLLERAQQGTTGQMQQ